MREILELSEVPHFTTLQKAENRLLSKVMTQKLLQQTIKEALSREQMKRIVELAAIDGSGFESRHSSHYFVRRRSSHNRGIFQDLTYTQYPKLGLLCDCSTHMALAIDVGRGPSPDIWHFIKLLKEGLKNVGITTLLADAGYDAESSHEFAREKCSVESIIPPLIGRQTAKPPTGKWRRLMKESFDKESYGQRWQIETLFSMIKRRLGSARL